MITFGVIIKMAPVENFCERSSDDCSKCSEGINIGKFPPLSVRTVRALCRSQLLHRAKKVFSLRQKDRSEEAATWHGRLGVIARGKVASFQ